MSIGVAKPRGEATIATEGNFTESYEPRRRRAAVSFNYY
jgi:hypothetical protein